MCQGTGKIPSSWLGGGKAGRIFPMILAGMGSYWLIRWLVG